MLTSSCFWTAHAEVFVSAQRKDNVFNRCRILSSQIKAEQSPTEVACCRLSTGRDDCVDNMKIPNIQSFIKQQNNRFDGVVGYHVSLTFQLGSLKVSSSSLGRIISFCRRGGPVEKNFFASLPMWVGPCHNRSTADHTTWASAAHQETASWTIRRAFILVLAACMGLGIDFQSRKVYLLKVMSDIVSFESIVY
jgi:hypothetical protein